MADEAESHADVARDLLDCPNTGHTWHGYLAQQQWRAAREAAREEEGFAADDMVSPSLNHGPEGCAWESCNGLHG